MRRDGQCPRVPAGVELHYLSGVVLGGSQLALATTWSRPVAPGHTRARATVDGPPLDALTPRTHRSFRPMSTTAIASPAALAPAAATARPGSSGVRGSVIPARGVARRTAVATALTRSRFLGGDASPATFVSSATGSRARSRVVGARRVQTRALASPNELGDVAGTLGLTLSGFEQVMGKASFGALLGASSVYCYKVRVTTHPGS